MRKYFDADGLRDRIIVLKDGDDKKPLYILIAIVALALIAVAFGVVYLLNNKMEDDYEDEWDYDWDDEEEDEKDEAADAECCCTDTDVDDSVKIEQL